MYFSMGVTSDEMLWRRSYHFHRSAMKMIDGKHSEEMLNRKHLIAPRSFQYESNIILIDRYSIMEGEDAIVPQTCSVPQQ